MKALIFAAGLGERMRPLTDHTPKPLLQVGGKPLIVWHLEKLAALGVREIIINTSWLAGQFPAQLGDGRYWGVHLMYSHEGDLPLDTGGGMLNALPLLGGAPFIAVNGDIWTDFDFAHLPREPEGLAHLVMVDNPAHHPTGDFHLHANGRLDADGAQTLTFSGVGVYRPELLEHWRSVIDSHPGADTIPPRFPLAPLLRTAMARAQISGEHHRGTWMDVGTPKRLQHLQAALAEASKSLKILDTRSKSMVSSHL